MITEEQKQEFIAGYLEAALWSSSDTRPGEDGGETYINLDEYDWADEAAEKLRADCHDFMQRYGRLLERYVRARIVSSAEYTAWECAGHDFWLTRNGHGTGFWDGRGVVGEFLTKRCDWQTEFGGIDLYLGDDEKVYVA